VRRLIDAEGGNGVYDSARLPELGWDGKDEQGMQVPPGLYLVQVEVEGDARSSASVRTVGVAY
jgi:flagellar hook assembly protein FlgD